LAGSLAAIGCHRQGKKVAVVNKGRLCWSGSTVVCGGNDLAVFFPEDDKDAWTKAYAEISDFTVDQEWLKIFLDESYQHAQALVELGKKQNTVIFPSDPQKGEGSFWRVYRSVNPVLTTLCDLYAAQTHS